MLLTLATRYANMLPKGRELLPLKRRTFVKCSTATRVEHYKIAVLRSAAGG